MRVETIGNARLYLGDARELVNRLSGVTITDPPYGNGTVLNCGGMWNGTGIVNDADLAVRDAVLQTLDQPFAILAAVNKPRPSKTKMTLVWDKGMHVGAGDLAWPWKPNIELVHVGGEGWSGDHRGSSVLRYNAVAGCVGNRNDGFRWHPFEKPIALMRHLIDRAPPGAIVDPFMGSGTTGIAALQAGRTFVGVESEEEHFESACRRLRKVCGDDVGPLFTEQAA